MARVLTIDDSKALRTIVSRQLQSMGLDVDAAEDGEKGLEALTRGQFDLVLLDVTMPNLDGPGMLKRMRERGDKTPVIMLTSESKTTVIGECMKLGIEDYILKPFTPDEIREKIVKVLKTVAPDAAQALQVTAAAAPGAAPTTMGRADVLCIDDMENVHKKFRDFLPQGLALDAAMNSQQALTACRAKHYKIILIDSTLPDVDSVALLTQLRILQENAVFLSLTLRSKFNVEQDAVNHGFKGVLFKPFDSDTISDFMESHFATQNLVTHEGDLITLLAYTGKDERVDKYFAKVRELTKDSIQQVAAASYDAVLFDVSLAPLKPDASVKLFLDMHRMARKLGLELRIIGSPEAKKLCSAFTDTAAIPFFATVEEARA